MLRVGLVAIALVALAACGGDGSERDAGTGTAASSPAGRAVSVEGETLEGDRLSLAELRGTPVFVNVWASW